MSIALSVHLQVLSWSGLAILAPVIVIGGIRRVRSRLRLRLRRGRRLRSRLRGRLRRLRLRPPPPLRDR